MGLETALIAATVLSVAGSVATAVQSRKQAKANEAQARLAEQREREQSAFESSQHQKATAALLSSQRAHFAAMGMDLGDLESTPMTVLKETEATRASELAHLERGGQLSAMSYGMQADAYGSQASMAVVQGGLGVADAMAGGFLKYSAYKETGRIS